MKKLLFVLMLVALLLSLTLTVVLAECPDGEDPLPPGGAVANNHNGIHDVFIPGHAACSAGFVGATGC